DLCPALRTPPRRGAKVVSTRAAMTRLAAPARSQPRHAPSRRQHASRQRQRPPGDHDVDAAVIKNVRPIVQIALGMGRFDVELEPLEYGNGVALALMTPLGDAAGRLRNHPQCGCPDRALKQDRSVLKLEPIMNLRAPAIGLVPLAKPAPPVRCR